MAQVLAKFMDNLDNQINKRDVYDIDFRFACVLNENLHHRAEGYSIIILVYTEHSNEWTNKFLEMLIAENLQAVRLAAA